MLKAQIELIKKYSKETYNQMTRQPEGQLKYPYIVPGSKSYNTSLWDWDSWLTDIAVRQIMLDNDAIDEAYIQCEKGCIINFLEFATPEGRIPICITRTKTLPQTEDFEKSNIHKPCLAQHAAFVLRETGGDATWLMPYIENLENFVKYYMKAQRHEETGLYFWINDMAVGVDNDPSIFYKPDRSCASIYLNCLMYRELLALCYILKLVGRPYEVYKAEAENLKKAINELLYDERNGFYYSADLNLRPIDPNTWLHSGRPRHWHSLIMRIDSWSGVIALWAGVADKEKAERTVKENLLKPELFNAPYGIRTLAKTEKMYCVVKSGNPSCWLGPIWGISNYMAYRGMMNYGFILEAKELAEKTIRLFGEDLAQNGQLHEYYDPENGVGVNNPGFQNWNLLVNNMIAELEGRTVVREF